MEKSKTKNKKKLFHRVQVAAGVMLLALFYLFAALSYYLTQNQRANEGSILAPPLLESWEIWGLPQEYIA